MEVAVEDTVEVDTEEVEVAMEDTAVVMEEVAMEDMVEEVIEDMEVAMDMVVDMAEEHSTVVVGVGMAGVTDTGGLSTTL